MIIFGPYTAFIPIIESGEIQNGNYVVYNLNSPINYGYSLSYIFPSNYNLGTSQRLTEEMYDLWICDYLMNTKEGFTGLMNIMYSSYLGKTVICIIDNAPWSLPQVESLIKFIQCRYGVEVNLINEYEDLQCVKPPIFTQLGRQTFNADKERFVYENFNQFMSEIKPED